MERLLIRVLRDAGADPVDLSVDLSVDTTVAELAAHLARATGAGTRAGAGAGTAAGTRAGAGARIGAGTDPAALTATTLEVVWPAERATGPLDGSRPVSSAGPPSGSTVRFVPAAPSARSASVDSPVLLVHAGGSTRRLLYGANDVDGVRIDVGTSIELCSTGAATGTRNGERVRGCTRLAPGDLVGAGALLAVVRVDGELSPPPGAGVTVAHAAVRAPAADDRLQPVSLPDPPASVRTPGFPVLSAMVPLLMGVGLWVATRSVAAAAFVFFSFVFVVASGIEMRRESRAEQRFREQEFRDDLAEVLETREQLRRRERAEAAAVTPGGAGCLERIDRLDPLLWSSRPLEGDPAGLVVSVGTAAQAGRHRLVTSGQGRRDLRRDLDALVARSGTHDLPVQVDLLEHSGLAVVGSDEAATDLARSLVLQVVATVGPDQLSLQVLAAPSRRGRWAWTSWLPHVESADRGAAVRSDAVRLIVVDGATDDEVAAALGGVAGGAGASGAGIGEARDATTPAVLWLAESAAGLPRHLRTWVEVRRDDATLFRSFDRGADTVSDHDRVVEAIRPDVLHEDEALPGARRLAALRPGGSTLELRVPGDGATSAASNGASNGATPNTVRFDEVLSRRELGDDPAAVLRTWEVGRRDPVPGLSAPIGRAGAGVASVDLELDGPHALVAGTTGAGKSELLRTLLGSLAVHHPPDRLTFLLVDYKGGAAFRSLVALPHTVGLVTDLSGTLAARALVSLRAEVTRRERLLERHGATDLAGLTAARSDSGAEAPPSLVVAVDEFATLANEVPGFVDGLVDVAQRGRSLGIHLLLATQRPAGVVTDHIRANTSLRICLRVADDDESRDVIGVADAGRIARTSPGRAIIRIGADRPFPVQVAWSGGTEVRRAAVHVRPLHPDTASSAAATDTATDAGASEGGEGAAAAEWSTVVAPTLASSETQLDRAVRTIGAAALAEGRPLPRRPWLDPLPEHLGIDELPAAPSRPGLLGIGLRDLPHEQRQDLLTVDLARDGGVLVLGANRSGRTTALVTIAAAAVGHPVDPAHVYAIDSGTELGVLSGLCGVGDVVRSDEIERVTRLVRAVHAEVVRRRGGMSGPRLVLLIDGCSPLEELHERVNRGELFDQLVQIARDGRTSGVHLVVGAHRRSEVRPSLAAALGSRIDLRFPTEDDAAMAGCDAAAADRDRPAGRCVHDGAEAQIAVTTIGAGDHLDAGTLDAGTGAGPPPVPQLPDRITLDQISPGDLAPRGPIDATDPSEVWRAVIGVDADTLDAVSIDLGHHHGIVAGPSRSGRSETLVTVAASFASSYLVRARPPSNDVPGSADPRWVRSWHPLDEQAGLEDLVSDALTAAVDGRPTLLAVDDLPELLDGPDEAMVEALLLGVMDRSRTVPIRLVVSGEIDSMSRCYGDLVARLRSGRTGVLLRPDPDLHGGLLHATLSARDDLPAGPGRGWLVHPSGARPVQVAAVDTTSVP